MLRRGGGCGNGSSCGRSLSHPQQHLQTDSLEQQGKLSQRNDSLSWYIPLLILLLAPVPAPWPRSLQEAPTGPSCFVAGLSCPMRHPHAEEGDGTENDPTNTLLGGCCCGCVSLPAACRELFQSKSGLNPCAGASLWCRWSRHGIGMWTEL